MATHDATELAQFKEGGVKYPEGQGRVGVVHFHINIADLVADLGAAVNPSTPDLIDIWDIPIGTCIFGVLARVVTAATTTAVGGTATMAIGDAADGSGYMAAMNLKTAAYSGTIITDVYGAARKVYSAASTLRLTLAGTATVLLTGILDIFVFAMFADMPAAEPSAWT